MSPVYLLDSSALLAYFRREEGWEKVEMFLTGSAISTVNLGEVLVVLNRLNIPTDTLWLKLVLSDIMVIPFTIEDLDHFTPTILSAKDLSFGDKACIATGLRLGYPIVTGDRIWGSLAIPKLKLHFFR